MNWIIPGKMLAFSGPSPTPKDPDGWRVFTPEDYVPLFKKQNIDLVIRLNKKRYDKKRFTADKIKHVDLYYIDGSTPKPVKRLFSKNIKLFSRSLKTFQKQQKKIKTQWLFIVKLDLVEQDV